MDGDIILDSKLNSDKIDSKSSLNYLIDTLMYLKANGTTHAQRKIINNCLAELNKLNISSSERSLPKYIYYDSKEDRYMVRRTVKKVRYTIGYTKSLPQAEQLIAKFNKQHNLDD